MTIEARVVRVVDEYDLEMNANVTKLGFRLPTGDIVYSEVNPAVLDKLKRYNMLQEDQTPAPQQIPVARRPPATQEEVDEVREASAKEPLPDGLEPAPDVEEYGAHVDLEGMDLEDEVVWMSLPDTVLPDHVKKAMQAILQAGGQALPPSLQLGQVTQIRDAILDEYTADDWERLGFTAERRGEVPVNQVVWSEGSTHQPNARYQRRVSQVDDKGNPIVRPNSDDVDPGEIAATGDEDGVDEF
jgi:hypothetical protein